jgi:hypothetical protein
MSRWLENLPTHTNNAGLEVVQFTMRPFSQSCVPIVTNSFLMLHIGLLNAAYRAGLPFLPPREEADNVLAGALDAVKNGGSYHYTTLALLAQKPLSS